MADRSSVVASAPVSGEDLGRAEEFAREPFVLEGEDATAALAEGTARRAALNAALAELDAGRTEPSVGWRRDYSLTLGLERVLAEDEPHLVDGTVLSAHQVDALSGTLIALTAELLVPRPPGSNGHVAAEELPSGEVELEGDELTDEEPRLRPPIGSLEPSRASAESSGESAAWQIGRRCRRTSCLGGSRLLRNAQGWSIRRLRNSQSRSSIRFLPKRHRRNNDPETG